MKTLILKELKERFSSPAFFVIAAVFCFMAGIIFLNIVSQYEMILQSHADKMVSAQHFVVVNYFNNLNFLLVLLIPILGMNSLAKENQQGTLDLLMTSGLSKYQVLLGKFISQAIAMLFLLSLLSAYLITMAFSGLNDLSYIAFGCLGLFLNSLLYLAIGILCNAFFERPTVAVGFLQVVILVVMNSIHSLSGYFHSSLLELITYLSVSAHFLNVIRASFYSSDVVFYLLAMMFALVFAKRILDWKEI